MNCQKSRIDFVAILCVCMTLAMACHDNETTAKGTAADSAVNSDPNANATDVSSIVPYDTHAELGGPFTDETSAPNCPGSPGCACKDNTDCQTGLCIDDASVAEGKACAKKCDGICPEGYACANIPGVGRDILNICVPKYLHLCEPCSVSKDCESLGLKDPACVDQGQFGRYCGVSCVSGSDCPAEYACQEVATAEGGKLKQCVRKSDVAEQPFGVCTCTAAAVQKKLATMCWNEVKDLTFYHIAPRGRSNTNWIASTRSDSRSQPFQSLA